MKNNNLLAMRHLFVLALLFTLAVNSLHAQKDRLSIGLNVSYPGGRELGLGGAIDYQHRLAKHWELLGEFSAVRTLYVGQLDERTIYKSGTYGFLGAGFGYRSGDEQRGFHIGLLAGGLLYPFHQYEYTITRHEMQLLPALGANIGHSIGARGDLGCEMVLGRARDRTYPGFMALKFSYLLFKKD